MRRQHAVIVGVTFMLALLCVTAVRASNEPERDLFQDLKTLVHELDRYIYLVSTTPELSPDDQRVANQLLAATEGELGLYSEAVRDFPLRNQPPPGLTLPRTPAWRAADAVITIATLARSRRIVMVNEAHHDAHTRQLTLALLPRLRAEGFRYFAVEALGEKDLSLMQRGYPIRASGSEYLREPLYGDMIREAIRLGYVLVPYDTEVTAPQTREYRQAENLYRRVFLRDPDARLFIHAGYAHIDKQRARLGPVEPMAMRLRQLTGIEPFSIDQTEIREESPRSEARARVEFLQALTRFQIAFQPERPQFGREGPGDTPDRPLTDAYDRIIALFHPLRPVVLVRADNGTPWSARPHAYDLNVILPPANPVSSDYMQGPIALSINGKDHLVMPAASRGHRPGWLTLDGRRVAVPMDTRFCADTYPCLLEAHYAGEDDDATAADRYLFLQQGRNFLYLHPGKYRLCTIDAHGIIVNEQTVQVSR